MQYVEGL